MDKISPNIDELLTRLAQAAPDRTLDQLEPLVLARIRAAPMVGADPTVWGWRASLAAALIAIGALTGAAAARPASELALFSAHVALAPSTLLGSAQ